MRTNIFLEIMGRMFIRHKSMNSDFFRGFQGSFDGYRDKQTKSFILKNIMHNTLYKVMVATNYKKLVML